MSFSSNANSPPIDPELWCRSGPGKRIDFYCTDSELQNWLLETFPEQDGPFVLTGSDQIKLAGDRSWTEVPFEYRLNEFARAMAEQRARFVFFVRSLQLSSALNLKPGQRIAASCSLNGLVGIDHGGKLHDSQMESSISIVHRVAHFETGQIINHEDYRRFFERLKRAIRPSLIFSTVDIMSDGSQHENTRVRMTEGAVEQSRCGKRFTRIPGARIR